MTATKSIAGPSHGLAALLEWNEPIGVAFYPDLSEKARLVERMRALAPPRNLLEVRTPEEALQAAHPGTLIIIDPQDEAAAVSFLDQNRDHFSDNDMHVVVLLLRGGTGEEALRSAPSLASFARAGSFEVVADTSHEEAIVRFTENHGMAPQLWLARWKSGDFEDSLENNLVLSSALALADSQ